MLLIFFTHLFRLSAVTLVRMYNKTNLLSGPIQGSQFFEFGSTTPYLLVQLNYINAFLLPLFDLLIFIKRVYNSNILVLKSNSL